MTRAPIAATLLVGLLSGTALAQTPAAPPTEPPEAAQGQTPTEPSSPAPAQPDESTPAPSDAEPAAPPAGPAPANPAASVPAAPTPSAAPAEPAQSPSPDAPASSEVPASEVPAATPPAQAADPEPASSAAPAETAPAETARAETAPTPPRAAALQPPHTAENWPAYGGSNAATRYTEADEINPDNASRLVKVWEYHTGDLAPDPASNIHYAFQNTPQKIGDSLYVCTPSQILIALDPATGTEKWRFDPEVSDEAMSNIYHATCRGVAYYQLSQAEAEAVGECPARIVYGTSDGRLLAVDAETGAPCPGFGDDGAADLKANMGEMGQVPGFVSMNSPPTIVRGVVVVGHQVRDNQRDDAPSGVVRGYDAVTGDLRWAWDLGRPGQTGAPADGETYTPGTPNVWTMTSADEELGLVYLPTGNSANDYWGANRSPEEEEFTASLVAVDVETGEVRWHFRTVNHDIWDYDLGSQATLVDFPTESGPVPALILPSKQGQIFVLDRRTGEPVLPVEEVAVPQGAEDGEWTAATQPTSPAMPDIIGDDLTEKDAWGISPLDQLWCRIQFRLSRYEGYFTPPSTQGTIVYPGYNGGVDWGGVAVDPGRNILIVNNNRLANLNRLIPREAAEDVAALGADGATPNDQPFGPQAGAPYAADAGPWMSPLNIPCIAPPWGYIGAVDLTTREFLWRKPLGTGYDQGPFGIPSRLKIPMGTPNNGGALVTAGGVTFIAATLDYYLRAYATETGDLLWEGRLPAGGQAGPMSYTVDGRQFVVQAAGGHHFMQTKMGDSVVAYALEAGE